MNKQRKVFQPKISRADALVLWSALSNVTTSQAGDHVEFRAIAAFTEELQTYFDFQPSDAEKRRADTVPTVHSARSPFLYV